VILGVAVSGCAQGAAILRGTSFNDPSSTEVGEGPLPPGAKLGILNLSFWNSSHQPLTIIRITITGHGIGTVVRLVEVKIAPITYVPGTLYTTDPPVYHFLHQSPLAPVGCSVQPLRPVHGYVVVPRASHLSPLGGLRIWTVVQTMRPGTYNNLGDTVYYTQAGKRYRQFIPFGFGGSVVEHAAWPPVYNDEKGCVDKTHLLNPGTGG
jgi:hypothetical protein